MAHRLSTVRSADVIIALKDGQVVETGSHEQLMQHKGLYYGLVTSQTAGGGAEEEEEPLMEEDEEEEAEEEDEAEDLVVNEGQENEYLLDLEMVALMACDPKLHVELGKSFKCASACLTNMNNY